MTAKAISILIKTSNQLKALSFAFAFLTFFMVTEAQEPDYPNRIMLTISGDPATSRAVSWRTPYHEVTGMGEIVSMNVAPELNSGKTTISATSAPWAKDSEAAMGHKVIFENLQPNTEYAYRVGYGSNWSEWFQFITSSDTAEPFSFLYFGDIQNDIKSYGSRVIRKAYSHFPDSDFMIFAGDLVNRCNDEEWKEFFYAGGWIYGMKPSLPTPGNHEYQRTNDRRSYFFSTRWNQIFTMPSNAPIEKFYNRCYYLDYQGVRFISIDSPAMIGSIEDGKIILDWLDRTLTLNPNPWAVVFTHFPVYSCSKGRTGRPNYNRLIKALYEKHGVDIVLQGHDHTYCRGQNLTEAGDDVLNYPMYVVSVSGAKMYEFDPDSWSDVHASDIQLYQHISFTGNSMSYKSFTADGEIFDSFHLVKNEDGVNEVIND
jgi:hypothetical protein